MEFKTVTEINAHLVVLVKNERKLTHEILTHIYMFEKCNGPVKMGYASTFQYLTRHLGYSDDQAFRRLKAAKVLCAIPEAAEQFQNGQLNLSQAAQAQKAFEQSQKENKIPVTLEKKKEVLNQIQNNNNFNTQKVLAESLNLTPTTIDHTRPQSNKTIQVQIHFTEAQFQKLESLKSLVSHKVPDQKLADILEIAIDLYIDKKSMAPKKNESSAVTLNRQKSLKVTKTSDSAQCLMVTKRQCDKKRTHIPVKTRRELFKKAGGCCEYVSDLGVRCQSRFKLQTDHIRPIAFSGENNIENLSLKCSIHNQLAASEMGIGYETVRSNLHKDSNR